MVVSIVSIVHYGALTVHCLPMEIVQALVRKAVHKSERAWRGESEVVSLVSYIGTLS